MKRCACGADGKMFSFMPDGRVVPGAVYGRFETATLCGNCLFEAEDKWHTLRIRANVRPWAFSLRLSREAYR